MAKVVDSSGNLPNDAFGRSAGKDDRIGSVNRTVTQDPNGAIVPTHQGEIVHDTTNNAHYKALGTTNADWGTVTISING